MFCPLGNLSTFPGDPVFCPVTLKNVGLTPVNESAKPTKATIALSTSSAPNCLNRNSIDFNAAYLPLKKRVSSFKSPLSMSYLMFGLLPTNLLILSLSLLIPLIYP